MTGQLFTFDSQSAMDRVSDAVRYYERLRRQETGGEGDDDYESPAGTVVVKANSALGGNDGAAPVEKGVYLAKVVARDPTVTDPDAANAWVELPGFCEAFGPNSEMLAVGQRYTGRGVGTSPTAPFRPRVLVNAGGGGGSGLVLVQTLVPDQGQWTRSAVRAFGPAATIPTATGDEVVGVRALNAATTPGGAPSPTVGARLKQGGYYACLDTGRKGPVTGAAGDRRLLYAVVPPRKQGGVISDVVCDPTTGRLTAVGKQDVWVFDV